MTATNSLIEYLLENQFVAPSAGQRSLIPLHRLAERDESFVEEVRSLDVAYMPRGQTNDRRGGQGSGECLQYKSR